MITMMKNRSRNFFIKTAQYKRRLLLKSVKTSDLVAALEARSDVCTVWYVAPDENFYIDVNNHEHAEVYHNGPAVLLKVVD